MNIGDEVINDLTGEPSQIVMIADRNYFEKSPDDFDKTPRLSGNSVVLRCLDTGEFHTIYEWETTPTKHPQNTHKLEKE